MSILIETHAGKARPVRRYDFTYSNDSANGLSLLQAIQVVGFDDQGIASKELPPLEFATRRSTPRRRNAVGCSQYKTRICLRPP